MKYELETIPVWEALKCDTECLLCHLADQAHSDAVSYYLGDSVMNPPTRVALNEKGFCPTHWASLQAGGHPHSLALIGHTHLQQTIKELEPLLLAGSKKQSYLKKLSQVITKRSSGCLICTQIQQRMERYSYTVAVLWEQDSQFQEALANSKGFCLYHLPQVVKMGQTNEFVQAMGTLMLANLKRLEQEIWWMSQKYKDENKDKPWNGSQDAHKRVVEKLIGRSRLYAEP